MRLPQRSSKAFTLIELIVVIVILGLLALIAIPTFGKVITKSQDESTLSTLRSIGREAQALRALSQSTAWGTHPADAISDTALSSANGIYAATTLTPLPPGSLAYPKRGQVGNVMVGDEGLVLSMLSDSGRVCIAGFGFTATGAARCGLPSPSGEVQSDDYQVLPPSITPAPTPAPSPDPVLPEMPADCTTSCDVDPGTDPVAPPLVEGPLELRGWSESNVVHLTWTPQANAKTYRVKSNDKVLTTIAGTTFDVTGLTSLTEYTFTVEALNADGTVQGTSKTFTISTGSGPTRVFDDFNRASSAYQLGTIPDGSQTWQTVMGTMGISSQHLYTSKSTALSVLDVGSSDQMTTLERPSYYGGAPNVVVRFQDAQNYVYVRTSSTSTALYKVVNGVTTKIGTTNSWGVKTMRVVTSGSDVKVYMIATHGPKTLSTPVMSYTGTLPTGTKTGVYSYMGGADRWADNFDATALSLVDQEAPAAYLTERTATSLSVAWPAASGATRYTVHKDGSPTALYDGANLSYTDSSPGSGTHTYQVYAYSATGKKSTASSVTASLSPYMAAVLNDRPSAYWTFDEPTGSALPASSATGSNPLAYRVGTGPFERGTASLVGSDPWGSSVAHSSATHTTNFGSETTNMPTGAFTHETWLMCSPLGRSQAYYSVATGSTTATSNATLLIVDNTSVRINRGDASDTTFPNSTVCDGTPHQVVVTWASNGLAQLYVDGQFRSSVNNTSGVISANAFVVLGQDQDSRGGGFDGGTQSYGGTMDDTSVYDRVLTAEQIAAHYAAARS